MFKFDFKTLNPITQGIFYIVLISIIAIFCFIFSITSMYSWSMILAPIFLFICSNPIIGAFKQKPLQYTSLSIIVLITLATYIYITGNFISDFKYQQTQELQLIATLVFIFYILLSTLCVIFRTVLYLLNEADK